MKIEMVLPTLSAAGMETMIARMAVKLTRRGHAVGITCVEEAGALGQRMAEAGIRVSELRARGLVNPDWLLRMSRHVRTVSPDVVHVHSGALLKGVASARLARTPVVVATSHGFVENEQALERRMDRLAYALSHHVVAVSDHLRDHLAATGVARDKISVIVNGIDTDQFRPAEGGPSAVGQIRQRLGIAPSTVLVGTVARLVPIKNQAMLIEGVAQAIGRGADCAAVLIGDGPLRAELAARAQALGIGARVHFWGVDLDVARLYRELDIFTLTSDLEGTSISLLEAMASGVCPVATAVGGNTALIEDGKSGMLVPAADARALADAIEKLVAQPSRRADLGACARQRTLSRFSDEAMIDAYEKLYAQRCPASASARGESKRSA